MPAKTTTTAPKAKRMTKCDKALDAVAKKHLGHDFAAAYPHLKDALRAAYEAGRDAQLDDEIDLFF